VNSDSFKNQEEPKESISQFLCKVITSAAFCVIYGVYAFGNPDHPEERKDCFVMPKVDYCLDS